MDNFRVKVVSEGRDEFDLALGIAFAHAPGKSATHYAVNNKNGLTFFWHEPEKVVGLEAMPLPYAMNAIEASHFAWGWLQSSDYGREPDHDGDNGKGWQIYNEDWGHAAGSCYGFVSIRPAWAMYGK